MDRSRVGRCLSSSRIRLLGSKDGCGVEFGVIRVCRGLGDETIASSLTWTGISVDTRITCGPVDLM